MLSLEWAPWGDGQRCVADFAQAEEVAALIAFLASDDAAMITGSNYLIDGGFTSV